MHIEWVSRRKARSIIEKMWFKNMSDGWVEWASKARIDQRSEKKNSSTENEWKKNTKQNEIKYAWWKFFSEAYLTNAKWDSVERMNEIQNQIKEGKDEKRNCPFYARIKFNSEVQIKRGKKGRHGYYRTIQVPSEKLFELNIRYTIISCIWFLLTCE